MTLLIGLTGGIGTGKTFCANIFESLEVPVYYSDVRAKQLMTEHEGIRAQLIEHFGAEVYDQQGSLNRAYLARRIFNNKDDLSYINSVVHPAVRGDFVEWVTLHGNSLYVIQESAILYDTGAYQLFDKMILVHAPMDLRIRRIMVRDGVSRSDVRDRMNNQSDLSKFHSQADFIIQNDGESSVIQQVYNIHRRLSSTSEGQ